MSDWRENMRRALAAAGCKTQTEFVARYPGKHCWFEFHGLDSCTNCGVVRRRDDQNAPCKGIVRIALR